MTTPSKTNKGNSTKPSKKRTRSSESTPRSAEITLSPFARRFVKRIQDFVFRNELWKKDSRIIVGVSGGPDSLSLLDVLAFLAPKYGFHLHIAHVNYSLRGRASDLDEKLVRERADSYGFPYTVLHPKKKITGNLESALRDLRYDFFETVRKRKDFDMIAVAHSEDDQAETFLFRLLRGSGFQGLSAMRPKNGRIIRPFLETSREDILRYLEERQLSYRMDESNRDPRFTRNRIRHELLPLLEEKFQPKAKKILATTASLLAEDYSLLEGLFPAPVAKKTGYPLRFSRSAFLDLPLPAKRLHLRTLLKPYFQEKPPEKKLIDEIIKALKSTKNKHRILVFRKLKLTIKGDTVTLVQTV